MQHSVQQLICEASLAQAGIGPHFFKNQYRHSLSHTELGEVDNTLMFVQ